MALPKTIGELKQNNYRSVSVKNEMRANLLRKLRAGERVFPGIVGYDETVVPQIINALLSRHNMILLGLRGQAKSRIIRQLTSLLDEYIPVIAGSEVNDDPSSDQRVRAGDDRGGGDRTPIAWIEREGRFVENSPRPM